MDRLAAPEIGLHLGSAVKTLLLEAWKPNPLSLGKKGIHILHSGALQGVVQ